MDLLQIAQIVIGPILGATGGWYAAHQQAQRNRADVVKEAVETAVSASKQANEDTRQLLVEYRQQSDRNTTRIRELETQRDVDQSRVRVLDAAQALSQERIKGLETQDVERLVRITALEAQNRDQQHTIDGQARRIEDLADDVTVARGREFRLLKIIDRLINILREHNIELPEDLDLTELLAPMVRKRNSEVAL